MKPYLLLLITFTGFLSYSYTHSYLSDSAASSGNTFTASAEFPTPTPAPINPGDVVINEINWGGNNEPSSSNDEWVELVNNTSFSIDLTNWVIQDLGAGASPTQHYTLPSGTISSNGFFLISGLSQENSRINIAPDLVFSGMNLHNNGELLVLKDDGGNIIDTANRSDDWYAGTDTDPKKSMEKISPSLDGTLDSSWEDANSHVNMDGPGSTDEFGTPKAANNL